MTSPLLRRCTALACITLLTACSHRPEPPAPVSAPRPTVAASAVLRSQYHFEAERAAMSRGCVGPGGVRPHARATYSKGALEWFDVQCVSSVQRVRCDTGVCTPIR